MTDLPTPTTSDGALSSAVPAFLRHTVATLAYRGSKVIRDAPSHFSTYPVAPGSRTPVRILAHIGDLLDWALSMARGHERWHDSDPLAWDLEVVRFFAALERLERSQAAWRKAPPNPTTSTEPR